MEKNGYITMGTYYYDICKLIKFLINKSNIFNNILQINKKNSVLTRDKLHYLTMCLNIFEF